MSASNSDKRLGEKIRELRLQRGITQKELAGDRITRNMLSLIESGSASPSISTLLYLAEQLAIPVGYFFTSSSEEESRFFKMSMIDELKEAFRQKKFRDCQKLCAELPQSVPDDELNYILAVSFLNTALECANELDLRSAAADLEKAERHAALSLYCGGEFSRALNYTRALFTSAFTADIPDVLCDPSASGEFVSSSCVQYFLSLRMLKAGQAPRIPLPRNSCYERHLAALNMLTEGRQVEAMKRLRELSMDQALPYFMQYRVLCDLEDAANLNGDIRLAYSASRRKLELVAKYRI